MLLFSKIFIKVNLYIINFVKVIISFAFLNPFKFIIRLFKRIIFKPITFLFINIRKILSTFKINFKSLFNKKKKDECKKDFV